MGLFLAASGVIGADIVAVERSIRSFCSAKNGIFEPASGTTNAPGISVIAQCGSNTTILYPSEFMLWNEASTHLSKELHLPVFMFHIHDSDLWMFVLYLNGEVVSQFNPIPEYWEELDSTVKATWRGDAQAICKNVPGLLPDSIDQYLVEWADVEVYVQKAYPDDKFPYGNEWQMMDFMRRVGLKYPLHDDGKADGNTYRLQLNPMG